MNATRGSGVTEKWATNTGSAINNLLQYASEKKHPIIFKMSEFDPRRSKKPEWEVVTFYHFLPSEVPRGDRVETVDSPPVDSKIEDESTEQEIIARKKIRSEILKRETHVGLEDVRQLRKTDPQAAYKELKRIQLRIKESKDIDLNTSYQLLYLVQLELQKNWPNPF